MHRQNKGCAVKEGLYFEEYTPDLTLETGWASVTNEKIGACVELNEFHTPTYTDPGYMQKAYGGRMAPRPLLHFASAAMSFLRMSRSPVLPWCRSATL